MTERPNNPVVIRFGTNTPFFPMSFSYGMIFDPSERIWFVSLDHYVGYHMLARADDRRTILSSPNGWLAWHNLQRILTESRSFDGDPVIRDGWETDRDEVVARGLRLKYSQSVPLGDLLLKTRNRPILDESRMEDDYWCHCRGNGANRHGTLLEALRDDLRTGSLVEFTAG